MDSIDIRKIDAENLVPNKDIALKNHRKTRKTPPSVRLAHRAEGRRQAELDGDAQSDGQSTDELGASIIPSSDALLTSPDAAFSRFLRPYPGLLAALEALGFRHVSPIQFVALPLLGVGLDVVLQAKNGTGKTLCFLIACFIALDLEKDATLNSAAKPEVVSHSLLGLPAEATELPATAGNGSGKCAKSKRRKGAIASPHCLILAPTRELARQIRDAAAAIDATLRRLEGDGPKRGRVALLYGGDGGVGAHSIQRQPNECCDARAVKELEFPGEEEVACESDDLASKQDGRHSEKRKTAARSGAVEGVRVVVGCPGMVARLIDDGALKLDRVRVFVVDEFDSALAGGAMGEQLERIVDALPACRQTVLASATGDATRLDAARRLLRRTTRRPVETDLEGAVRKEDWLAATHVVRAANATSGGADDSTMELLGVRQFVHLVSGTRAEATRRAVDPRADAAARQKAVDAVDDTAAALSELLGGGGANGEGMEALLPLSRVEAFKRKMDFAVRLLARACFSACVVFCHDVRLGRVFADELRHRLLATRRYAAYAHPDDLVRFTAGAEAQTEREAAYVAARTGRCKILVASDVLARGFDSSRVSLVLHLDCAASAAGYLHRVGRAGRFGAPGASVLLAAGLNDAIDVARLKRQMNCAALEPLRLPEDFISAPLSMRAPRGNQSPNESSRIRVSQLISCAPLSDVLNEAYFGAISNLKVGSKCQENRKSEENVESQDAGRPHVVVDVKEGDEELGMEGVTEYNVVQR